MHTERPRMAPQAKARAQTGNGSGRLGWRAPACGTPPEPHGRESHVRRAMCPSVEALGICLAC